VVKRSMDLETRGGKIPHLLIAPEQN
jgi:hypothetical protein